MVVLTIVAGLLLAGGGAFFLLLGFDIVMTERGNAMTIGGVIALSCGLILVAIGFALTRLTRILRALEARPAPLEASQPAIAAAAEPAPVRHDGGTPGFSAAIPAAAVAAGGALAAGVAAGVIGAGQASPEPTAEEVIPPRLPLARSDQPETETSAVDPALNTDDPAWTIADALSEAPSDPLSESHREESDDLAPEMEKNDPPVGQAGPDAPLEHSDAGLEFLLKPAGAESAGETEAPDEASADGPEAAADRKSDDEAPDEFTPSRPAVLGSYRAGGRTYTMFADGSVEAATERGVERFESMAALREHLART